MGSKVHGYLRRYRKIGERKQEFMEWVKCRDRLPEKEGRFCVRLTNGCISTDYYTLDDDQSDPQNKWKYYLVFAWMPLPEVYYPCRKGKSDWKQVCNSKELDELQAGDYFITVGDLVYVANKSDECLWLKQSRIPYNAVDAIMPVPVYLEL